MRLDVQWSIVAMCFLVRLEPRLVVESLRLRHVFEHVVPRPSRQFPVIVVLVSASYAESAVDATASAQELSAAELYLPVVDALGLGSYQIPVGLAVEVL